MSSKIPPSKETPFVPVEPKRSSRKPDKPTEADYAKLIKSIERKKKQEIKRAHRKFKYRAKTLPTDKKISTLFKGKGRVGQKRVKKLTQVKSFSDLILFFKKQQKTSQTNSNQNKMLQQLKRRKFTLWKEKTPIGKVWYEWAQKLVKGINPETVEVLSARASNIKQLIQKPQFFDHTQATIRSFVDQNLNEVLKDQEGVQEKIRDPVYQSCWKALIVQAEAGRLGIPPWGQSSEDLRTPFQEKVDQHLNQICQEKYVEQLEDYINKFEGKKEAFFEQMGKTKFNEEDMKLIIRFLANKGLRKGQLEEKELKEYISDYLTNAPAPKLSGSIISSIIYDATIAYADKES